MVTTGFARLTGGAAVAVTNAESAPPPGTEQPVPQRRRRGQNPQRSESAPSAGTSTAQR